MSKEGALTRVLLHPNTAGSSGCESYHRVSRTMRPGTGLLFPSIFHSLAVGRPRGRGWVGKGLSRRLSISGYSGFYGLRASFPEKGVAMSP